MTPLADWLRPITEPIARAVSPRSAPPGGDAQRAKLARKGERIAERYLRDDGYRLIGRNVHAAVGEIDLVMLDPDGRAIVFVEVKARAIAGDAPGPPPEASVTAHKKAKLVACVRALATREQWLDRRLRIDVIAVEIPHTGRPVLRHHPGAVRFSAGRHA